MSISAEIGQRIDAMIPDVPGVDTTTDQLCTVIAMLNERINLLEKELASTNKVVRQLSDIHP